MDYIGWSLKHPWWYLAAFTTVSLGIGLLLAWLWWPLALGWLLMVPVNAFRITRQNIRFALRDAERRGRYGADLWRGG